MIKKIIIARAYITMLFFDILLWPWSNWTVMRSQSKTILDILKDT